MKSFGFQLLAILLACELQFIPTTAHSAPPRDHQITLEDYFTQVNAFSVHLSSDGKSVVWREGRWNKAKNGRQFRLWVVDTATKKAKPLTSDTLSAYSAEWSSDSEWVYFLGQAGKKGTQVWRVRPTDKAPEVVTSIAGGVSSFALSPDGKSLFYVTSREVVDKEWKKLRTQFKKLNYGHGIRETSVLWQYDPATKKSTKILDNERVIREMSVSPKGDRIAMITTPDDKVISNEGRSRVDVLDLKTRKVHTLKDKLWRKDAPSPWAWLESLAWSPDGRAFAFNVIFDAYPNEIIIADWDQSELTLSRLKRPEGLTLKGYGTPIHWRSETELCFLCDERAYTPLYCAQGLRGGKQGKVVRLSPADQVIDAFTVSSKTKQAALIVGDTTSLPDVHLLEGAQELTQLTRLNPQADRWKIPQIKKVTWKGAKGDEVEGVLELPADYEPGKPIPLVLVLHGGPTTASPCQLRFWIYGRTLLPAQGYAVLCPNYRGSTGYGDKFLADLVGRENDVEVTDILKGVDAMVEAGIADPDRLGVMGWSNGGYLTNCLITHTTRFKAASSGASILDTTMEWGINDEPAYPTVFKKGTPWETPEIYRKTSPTYQLNKIRTPTLIHVGAKDERCPPGHSRMLYRALKEYVKVPTELILYPNEPHGLSKYTHRKAKMAWDLAWFKRYLRGGEEERR